LALSKINQPKRKKEPLDGVNIPFPAKLLSRLNFWPIYCRRTKVYFSFYYNYASTINKKLNHVLIKTSTYHNHMKHHKMVKNS